MLGVSMGGAVARYGLRDLEMHSRSHNTWLYGSFDSPHQGANIPLGLQAAVRAVAGFNLGFGIQLKDVYAGIARALKTMESEAARQMLIYQWRGIGKDIKVNNTPHNDFYNALIPMGLPQLEGIKRIAVASGSECGTDQNYNPYADFVRQNESVNLDYWLKVLGALLNTATTFSMDLTPWIIAQSPSVISHNLGVTAYIKMLPDKQALPIMNIKIAATKKILFGLISVSRTLYDVTKSSESSMLPLDSESGGSRGLNDDGQTSPIPGADKRFSFIPTFSSLNVGSGALLHSTPLISPPRIPEQFLQLAPRQFPSMIFSPIH